MSSLRFAIRPLNARDGPQVVDFLRRFFFRDEPLNAAAGLMAKGQRSCPEHEQFLLDFLPHGLSLKAVDVETGRLLGTIVNSLHRPEYEVETLLRADLVADPAFREKLRFISYVDLKVSEQLRNMFPGEDLRHMGLYGGSIDPAARGHGILTALIEHSRKLGKEKGVNLLRANCTSIYSIKAFKHLGFQKIFSVRYDDYQRNGKVVFPPTKTSGEELVTYIQKLK